MSDEPADAPPDAPSDAASDAPSNVTPLFGRTATHRRAVQSAHDQVIMEGGAQDDVSADGVSADEPAGAPTDGVDRLPIRITRLEMHRRPTRPVHPPSNQRHGLLRLREVPVPFYRFLFHGVGAGHHWRLPPGRTDEMLHAELNGPGREVHVLYLGGAPAGFFELDVARPKEAVALLCFGILPHARGRGFARWLLNEAMDAAWTHEPSRVRLQTNNLDSPIALRLYQSIGFEVTGQTDGWLILMDC